MARFRSIELDGICVVWLSEVGWCSNFWRASGAEALNLSLFWGVTERVALLEIVRSLLSLHNLTKGQSSHLEDMSNLIGKYKSQLRSPELYSSGQLKKIQHVTARRTREQEH